MWVMAFNFEESVAVLVNEGVCIIFPFASMVLACELLVFRVTMEIFPLYLLHCIG
jgi:hypothetical protein